MQIRQAAIAEMIRRFAITEDGAVSVDFVVLTAAITLLGFVVVGSFSGETVELADDISDIMSEQLE